jgi:hypothetical protein
MDLQEVGCGSMDLTNLALDRDRRWGTCECGNEPSGSIKCREFPEWMKTSKLLKKDSAAWSK